VTDFDPLEQGQGEFPAINPESAASITQGGDTTIVNSLSIPDGSVTDAKIAPGVSPTKLAGLAAKVYWAAAAQSIGTGSDTPVTFDTVAYDTTAMFDAAADDTILTLPYTGVYLIIAYQEWDSPSAGTYRRLRINQNGSAIMSVNTAPIASQNVQSLAVTTHNFTLGDTIGMSVQHDRGSNLSINTGLANNFLSATFLFPLS